MRVKGIQIKLSQFFCLIIYYGFAQYLPPSYSICGSIGKWLRYQCCKRIFKSCGKNVNIERKAQFGSGRNLVIGDNFRLGINCNVPSNIVIGNDVMMGPNCYVI